MPTALRFLTSDLDGKVGDANGRFRNMVMEAGLSFSIRSYHLSGPGQTFRVAEQAESAPQVRQDVWPLALWAVLADVTEETPTATAKITVLTRMDSHLIFGENGRAVVELLDATEKLTSRRIRTLAALAPLRPGSYRLYKPFHAATLISEAVEAIEAAGRAPAHDLALRHIARQLTGRRERLNLSEEEVYDAGVHLQTALAGLLVPPTGNHAATLAQLFSPVFDVLKLSV
jgi:hypothetical protein